MILVFDTQDMFLSNIAYVLGIDPRKITIVDVVRAQSRRRGLLGNASDGGTTVSCEIEPMPLVGFQQMGGAFAVLETAGNVAVPVMRSLSVLGNCTIRYRAAAGPGDTAIGGRDFLPVDGVLEFGPLDEALAINVTVLDVRGFRGGVVKFTVTLVQADGAALGAASVTVAIQDADPPPPPPPPPVDGTAEAVVQWVAPAWPDRPPPPLDEVLAEELDCSWSNVARNLSGDGEGVVWNVSGNASARNYTADGLPPYSEVWCRARMQTVRGWSAWGAWGAATRTPAVCGDGCREGQEQCDDGGTAGGDGCSATCGVEPGWACAASGGGGADGSCAADTCVSTCGNGRLDPLEVCDGGGADGLSAQGCGADCRAEPGWICPPPPVGAPSVCQTVCGDGRWTPPWEGCDDGNLAPGDGCSAACEPEHGAACRGAAGARSVCATCGDGRREGWEACDDGGASGACLDGCAAVAAKRSGENCPSGVRAPK